MLAAVIALLPATRDAASQSAPSNEGRKQQYKDAEQRAKGLQQEVATLVKDREQLNTELIRAGQDVQQSEARLTQLESEIQDLEVRQQSVQAALTENSNTLVKRLGPMLRMGGNPPPVISTMPKDALDAVRAGMLLAWAIPELRQQADVISGQLVELDRVIADLRGKRETEQLENQRLAGEQARVAALLDGKRQLLGERNRELDDLRKQMAELAKEPGSLAEQIEKLDREVKTKIIGPATTGTQGQDGGAGPVAGPGEPTPPPKPVQVAIEVPSRKAIEITPKPDATSANPGRLKPVTPFVLTKGRTPLPVVGKKILGFGEKTQYGNPSKGILVETRHSAQVVSPADGWIVYAGPFRSYGQLLIINCGEGYYVLLAGMHQIDVVVGQFVIAYEPVGTMVPSPRKSTQESAPVLYIEFRKEQRPIDPGPWWSDNSQKVQG